MGCLRMENKSENYQIPTGHRNIMQAENKTSGKYSVKKKTKSCSLKLEANRL